MNRLTARRLLAAPLAAILLAAGVVPLAAGPAQAEEVGGTLTPNRLLNSADNSAVTLTYTAPSRVFTTGTAVDIRVFRSADPSDLLPEPQPGTVTNQTGPANPTPMSNRVTQQVNLTRANPGPYTVQVYSAPDAMGQRTLLATCPDCLTVIGLVLECDGFTKVSGAKYDLVGSNFPKSVQVRFVKPGETVLTDPTKDDLGLQATIAQDPTAGDPTPSASLTRFSVNPAGALGGTHRVVIRSSSGQTAVCPGTFTVPKGQLVADALPLRQPPVLGRNSDKVPFTVSGEGVTAATTVAFSVPARIPPVTNGVSATVASFDAGGLHLQLSASESASTSVTRTVTYNAPDGGFFTNAQPLVVALNPSIRTTDEQGFTLPSPNTFGQGAVRVPVAIEVPVDEVGRPLFSYDGAGLTLTVPESPGFDIEFNRFLGTPDAQGRYTQAEILVSTIDTAADGTVVRPEPGDYSLALVNADGGRSPEGACDGCLSVVAGPRITSASPSDVSPGGASSFTINGSGFVVEQFLGIGEPTPSEVVLGPPGSFSSVSKSVDSDDAIAVDVNVPAGTSSRAATIRVTNPDDFGSDLCTSCLTIAGLGVGPITPPSESNTNSSVPVEIGGGPFTSGASVKLERSGFADIVASSVTLNPSGTLTAVFDLTREAPGAYSVFVSSPAAGSTPAKIGRCQGCFTVLGAQPTISSFSPTSGAQGRRIDLVVKGDNFAEGSRVVFQSLPSVGTQGVTALPGATVPDRKTLVQPVLIAANANLGPRNFSVTNTDGKTSPAPQSQFVVTAAPTANSVSPSSRAAGSETFTATISGQGFSDPVKSVEVKGGGVVAGTPTRVNATTVTVPLTVDASADPSARDVVVTNSDDGQATCAQCLTILAAPTITSVTPAVVRAGANATLTISGTGFSATPSTPTVTFGPGVTQSGPATSSATSISVPVTVDAATRGPVSVTVRNPDSAGAGRVTCAACFKAAVAPDAPVLQPAAPGDGRVDLTWAAPTSDGGSAVTGYVVSVTNAAGQPNGTVTVTGTSATVTGLTNGTRYSFDVRAQNAVGESPPSNAVVGTPAAVPAAPTGVTASAGNASATVSWTAPADGGSQITKYTVTATPGGATQSVTGTPAPTSLTFTGLTNGTAYRFTVVATNGAGDSAASSPSNEVTPQVPADGKPGAPGTPTATVDRAPGTADLSWAAPSSGTTPTSYRVEVTPAAGTVTYPTDRTTRTAVVSGLANGTSYTFKVYGTAAGGEGPASAASAAVVPYDVPGAPTGIAATGADGTLDVTWTAPAANGRPITSYTLVLSPADGTITYPTDRSQTGAKVTGLAQGRSYSASVVATNARGNGAAGTATLQSPRLVNDSKYVALSAPVRVADTRRTDTGVTAGRKQGAVTLDLASRIPGNATGALLNVTVTGPTAPGFVVVYPDGTQRPGTSNVNFATNQTQANEVVTGLSVDKKAVVFVSSTGSTHLVVDLVGYFTRDSVTGASHLVALTPSRAFGAESARNSRGGTVTVDLASRLPAGATGAILNVTVAAPTAPGFVVVYPAGSADPGTSNVNFAASQVQANEVVTPVGTGSNAGKVTLRLSAGTARLIVDVVGAVVPTTTSGSAAFTPLASPKRVLDTRSGQGNVGATPGRRGAGQAVEVTLPTEVPSDAKGVIINVTSTDQLGSGYVVVYPTGQSLPPTSNVNFVARTNQANEVVVGVGTGRRVTLAVGGGGSPQTHLIADVVGYLK